MTKTPVRKPSRRSAPKRPTPKPKTSPAPGAPRVSPEQIELVRTKGTTARGGGPGGEAWRIDVAGKRAGIVFINWIDEPPVGRHASIQIFLNKASQGRGIGREGYRRAAIASAYDLIYAHMRKSNLASRRAAEAAGFVEDARAGYPQLLMVWRRPPGE